ncbi:ferrous iron transport protein A [Candidatus Bathyarchaeota archaeon B24-2]|nr:MAG: ferrous iron transport protein A [Candidatus Bathyarchaeota archaeon B24-2]
MEIPLAFLPENKEAKVIEVKGGRGLVRRLSELGFTPGARVKVLLSNSPGPVLVDVRGSRLGLGRGLLMKIIVDTEVNS